MVKIRNDYILITRDDPAFLPLSLNLKYVTRETVRKVKRKEIRIPSETYYFYEIIDNIMYIPCGLYHLIKTFLINSEVHNTILPDTLRDTQEIIEKIDTYQDILEGIKLRNVQLEALKRILKYRRCIVQLSTGSGKSEVACALVEILRELNKGDIPTTIMLEPTVRLVDEMVARFQKYNIPVHKYAEDRTIHPNCVNITHPTSLNNDVSKNPNLLQDIKVLIGDESHHYGSNSYRTPIYHMPNLVYSVGLSASAILQEHINYEHFWQFNLKELYIQSATGPLVYNVMADSMIDSGNLSKPVLLMVHNKADEDLGQPINDAEMKQFKKTGKKIPHDVNDWHRILKLRLESDERTRLVAESARFFHEKGRKSLILVNTRRYAYKILELLDKYGLSEFSRASFGGGAFEMYDGSNFVRDESDVFTKYGNGEYTILIGTSHIYEGTDIPNLDALILAYGGRTERLQIQGCGRVLRLTKTGNRAYIVDFNDINDIVLSNHARMRYNRYLSVIGVEPEDIYYDISIKDFDKIFGKYEEI